jgi:eukaryotic-like serine/threonine-protein kinase
VTLTAGIRLGPYEIVSPIGAGGMGEVWRAHDSRLGRDVAVKVLPAVHAADPEALARFEREVRAVAALSHPNILAIHDFGAADGVVYAVMELLEGETLAARLARGALPPADTLRYATQLARGLVAAHGRRVVHRDLKPANLFLTRDGQLKILDFGLAKQVLEQASATADTRDTLTGAGVVFGTAGYMAPEQLRGEPADERSDLFAFGCVVFEMLTGHTAFRRATAAETIAATLSDEPPTAPHGALAMILARCLAKRREARWESAVELLADLERLATGPTTSIPIARRQRRGPPESVAVLPLKRRGGDADAAEYLCDGIAELIVGTLAQLPRLRVMARSTVEQLRGREDPPAELGRELGVSAVFAGRLSERAGRLAIDCELISVEDGTRLWGARYDRPQGEVMAVQEEIARTLADHLRDRLTPRQKRRLARPQTTDPEAYRAYLRGRHSWSRWTPDLMRAALAHYEEAIARDPLYALAWAGIGDSWAALGQTKAVAPPDALPKAKAATLRALELDPELGEAHASLGFIRRFFEWDWPGSESSFRRAVALAPGYATAHRWYGQLLSGLGRHDAAIAELRLALELDPLSSLLPAALGDTLFYARRYDEAVASCRRSVEMDPELLAGHSDLARALEYAGLISESIGEYERAIGLAAGSMADPSAGLANVYAVSGRRDEALAVLKRLESERDMRYVSPWALASIHARLGDTGPALDWLERAFEERDTTMVWLKVHPRFDVLRGEPRFAALLDRMKLA